jgi:hypothetical protein
VAVKKVKEEKDASIHHLRKLNHPNIIQVQIAFCHFYLPVPEARWEPGNTKGGRITVPLTSCLTGLELAV